MGTGEIPLPLVWAFSNTVSSEGNARESLKRSVLHFLIQVFKLCSQCEQRGLEREREKREGGFAVLVIVLSPCIHVCVCISQKSLVISYPFQCFYSFIVCHSEKAWKLAWEQVCHVYTHLW